MLKTDYHQYLFPARLICLFVFFVGTCLFAQEQSGGGPDPGEVDRLLKVLADDSQPTTVRAEAAASLGKMRALEAVPGLVAALYYPGPPVNRAAARALGNIGEPSAALEICKYMEEVNPAPYETRRALYDGIIKLNNPETYKILFDRARLDPQTGGKQMAADALDEMMGTDIGMRHDVRIKWVKKNRPEWKKYFEATVGVEKKFRGLALYVAVGGILVIAVGWYVYNNFL